jgi:hypothetical protein
MKRGCASKRADRALGRVFLAALVALGLALGSLVGCDDGDDDEEDVEAWNACVDACDIDYGACSAICESYCIQCDQNYEACLERCDEELE